MGGGLGRLGKHSVVLELKLSCGNTFVGTASEDATIPAAEDTVN